MSARFLAAAAPAGAAAAAAGGPRRPSPDRSDGSQALDGVMDELVRFCVDQRCAFEAGAWSAKFEEVGEPVALAAKYLSMTSWYGHEAELEGVSAATRVFADNSNGLHVESQAMDFDLHAFSIRVRLGLAHARRAVRTPRPSPVPLRESPVPLRESPVPLREDS